MLLLENWFKHLPTFARESNCKSTGACLPVAPYALGTVATAASPGHEDAGRCSHSTIQMRGTTITYTSLFFRRGVRQQAWPAEAGVHVTNLARGQRSWEKSPFWVPRPILSVIVPSTQAKPVWAGVTDTGWQTPPPYTSFEDEEDKR